MKFTTEILNFDEDFLPNFANKFNLLRQERSLIDLNILTKGGTSIPAHKLVLCAQFPGIKKSILESKHSNLSNWSRFPYDIVMAAVDFAYTGEIIINVENVLGIYLMAHNLGCRQLIDWTTEFIKTRLDRLDLMKVWSAANVTSNNDLIGVCIPRVACDFERLASSQPFLQHVGVDQLQTLLQSPWICDGIETLKFKTICTWLHASYLNDEHVKIEKHFRPLLKLIDMKKLPREVLMEVSVSGSDFNLSESARWRKLPPMPTPRSSTGAAHIPGVGDIVVGGWTKTGNSGKSIDKAEIFLTTSSPLGHAGSWCEITPMLLSRQRPNAEFFNGSVYVAGDSKLINPTYSVEMLSLFTEGPPQWTEVIKPTFKLLSLISFNGSLLFG
ncbi:unnamed protein product [Rodentolepis nana]|uniref:BTB domain-containing protein n=1 Tax=Rodentolepis nana TaxID=102285 RepID=A0A0R3TY37_RODNA|nr:unnamed protein product [Rodentolepis nana]